jgi:hypothetical protein
LPPSPPPPPVLAPGGEHAASSESPNKANINRRPFIFVTFTPRLPSRSLSASSQNPPRKLPGVPAPPHPVPNAPSFPLHHHRCPVVRFSPERATGKAPYAHSNTIPNTSQLSPLRFFGPFARDPGRRNGGRRDPLPVAPPSVAILAGLYVMPARVLGVRILGILPGARSLAY